MWIIAPKLNLLFNFCDGKVRSVTGRRRKIPRPRTFPSLVCRDFDSTQKVKWGLYVRGRKGRVVRRAPASLNQHRHQTKVGQGFSYYVGTYLSILFSNTKVDQGFPTK